MSGSSNQTTEETIQKHYIDYCVAQGVLQDDVSDFCIHVNIMEGDFYQHYEDIEALHSAIWKGWMTDTLVVLGNDEQFGGFSGREQLLAFYYTHLSVLAANRAFVALHRHSLILPIITPRWMMQYKEEYLVFVEGLLHYGKDTGEIADRFILNNQYDRGLWAQLLFVLRFWVLDDSHDQENTDALIEKAVNLSYELVRPSILDSAMDFTKFMYNNWRNK